MRHRKIPEILLGFTYTRLLSLEYQIEPNMTNEKAHYVFNN